MEIRDLRYFLAAAEIGQLRKAAEQIGRSQPALSKCIRRLEAEVGAKLFEPAGRGIRLTAVGQSLLPRARTLVRGMQDVVREITEMAEGQAGHVRVGSGPTTAEWLLPDLFRAVLTQSPGVTFEVSTGLGGVLRQSLSDGKLDLVVSPLIPGDTPAFTAFAVAEDVMVVGARHGHPLLQRGTGSAEGAIEMAKGAIEMRDLLESGWLLPSDSLASTIWLNRAFEAKGLPRPRLQVETDSVTLLRRVVARTDLLTFISRRDLVSGEEALLSEVVVPGLAMPRHLGALTVPGRYVPPAAQRLLLLLREMGQVGGEGH
jgi:DNA-binding transcriptional LysR family regulator